MAHHEGMGLLRRRKPAPVAADVDADADAGLSRADQEEQSWREGVEEHGWLVFDIPPDEPHGDGDGAPGFQFTVGLTERCLPEMIVYGLPEDAGMGILNDLADRLIAGQSFPDGEPIDGLAHGDYRLQLWDTTWLQDPLGAAFRLYGEEDVKVRSSSSLTGSTGSRGRTSTRRRTCSRCCSPARTVSVRDGRVTSTRMDITSCRTAGTCS